jgi:hypothetical protein
MKREIGRVEAYSAAFMEASVFKKIRRTEDAERHAESRGRRGSPRKPLGENQLGSTLRVEVVEGDGEKEPQGVAV